MNTIFRNKPAFIIAIITLVVFFASPLWAKSYQESDKSVKIEADNNNIHYVGRVDLSNPKQIKFSGAGAYINAKFKGTYIEMVMSAGTSNNYIQAVVDGIPVRVQMMKGKNTYKIVDGLTDKEHTILICKETEAAMGNLVFYGFNCKKLVKQTNIPTRKIECYGNSITCGAKMLQGVPCEHTNNNTNWNASNSAYLSYGAVTARALNAQWQLTCWSGIGLVSSCCGMKVTMPDVYDRLFIEQDSSPKWDFSRYVPDVVTICLGQNDGATVVLSQGYKDKFVTFIQSLRSKYPRASIFCITSPMADEVLLNAMNSSLQIIVDKFNNGGDKKVYKVEVPHGLVGGCIHQGHPSELEHRQVAVVLASAIKAKMDW
jgi:hypothetical protein